MELVTLHPRHSAASQNPTPGSLLCVVITSSSGSWGPMSPVGRGQAVRSGNRRPHTPRSQVSASCSLFLPHFLSGSRAFPMPACPSSAWVLLHPEDNGVGCNLPFHTHLIPEPRLLTLRRGVFIPSCNTASVSSSVPGKVQNRGCLE